MGNLRIVRDVQFRSDLPPSNCIFRCISRYPSISLQWQNLRDLRKTSWRSRVEKDQRRHRIAPLKTNVPRRMALEVHSHLRRLIISGQIRTGTILSQAELARDLEVSRTPIREAMRMLQEEGLLEISPNQRARVMSIDAEALESLYCRRVLLECLAVRLTVPIMSSDDRKRLRAALDALCTDSCRSNLRNFIQRNSHLHDMMVRHAGQNLIREIRAARETSELYLSLIYASQGKDWWKRPELEHIEIVAAYEAGQSDLAAVRAGQHLAQTAFELLQNFAPDYEPVRLREALKLIGSNTNASAVKD
ncbi:GntR family transcriptional regulator [Sinorhizobium meliloti]|nr:GntR family transcriptional regulator [Sinorhizobium meliloti]